ncbi:MAG: NAD(P)/FAD-dependent oxidoreductase [Anaerolineae bacterium]
MKLVIVGNGVAGTTTARLVAERDVKAEIAIYTDEPYLYYPRPRLIDYIAGEVGESALPQYADEWYRKRGIQVHTNQPVLGITPESHSVTLQDGAVVAYDQLVLANGATNFIPALTDSSMSMSGVHSLRNLHDAIILRDKAQTAKQTVILGGGLLGLDLAMALRANNTQVTVVEMMPRLLPRQLDAEGAALLTKLISARGVEVITNDSCADVGGQEHVEHITLKSGRLIAADLVVVSAGITPNIALAKAAGLTYGRGIMVDEHLRSSAADIYAVGDVAEYNKRVWGIIPAALAQARVAAASICGDTSLIYQDIVPSTTLKVTGIDLTSVGEVNPQGDGFSELRQQDDGAGTYKKLVLRDGRVIGAILLGDRLNVRIVNQLIEKRIQVTGHESLLFQPDLDIASLSN